MSVGLTDKAWLDLLNAERARGGTLERANAMLDEDLAKAKARAEKEHETARGWSRQAAELAEALAAARLALKPFAELNLRSECGRGYQPGVFYINDAQIKAARAASGVGTACACAHRGGDAHLCIGDTSRQAARCVCVCHAAPAADYDPITAPIPAGDMNGPHGPLPAPLCPECKRNLNAASPSCPRVRVHCAAGPGVKP